MVQLIKKGGLRERANRSRRYEQSENQQTTLKPNVYQKSEQITSAVYQQVHLQNNTEITNSTQKLVQHQRIIE